MEGHGRGGVGMVGKGGGGFGGGASGAKGRVKLTVLLLGAIVTSVVLVIGWETSPLSAFLLDPRKHTTRRKLLQPFPLPPPYRTDGRTRIGQAGRLCSVCGWLPACHLQLDDHLRRCHSCLISSQQNDGELMRRFVTKCRRS